MSGNASDEKPVRIKNILIGLAILPIIGIVLYGASEFLGINLSPRAKVQSQLKEYAQNQTKYLSELDSSETEEFRTSFVNDCVASAVESISESEARNYCVCTEKRVEQNFTVSQVNSWESMSQQELGDALSPHYDACAKELGLNS